MTDVLFPANFKELIDDYEKSYQQQIKEEYINLFPVVKESYSVLSHIIVQGDNFYSLGQVTIKGIISCYYPQNIPLFDGIKFGISRAIQKKSLGGRKSRVDEIISTIRYNGYYLLTEKGKKYPVYFWKRDIKNQLYMKL